MKVSIITITFNSEATITSTLESVNQQDYPNIEHIIIDGGSTDSTLTIVKEKGLRVTTCISEKDKGIYDAINKGISKATGDIVGLLHSDDIFNGSHIISEIVNAFKNNPTAELLYGDLQYVQREDTSQVVRNWISGPYKDGLFLKGWMPPHPTFYVRKETYQANGLYTLQLKSASDYELMLRYLHKLKLPVIYLPIILVKMRVGGMSNASFTHRWKANREDKQAWLMNGLKPNAFTLIQKPLSKLKQYIKK